MGSTTSRIKLSIKGNTLRASGKDRALSTKKMKRFCTKGRYVRVYLMEAGTSCRMVNNYEQHGSKGLILTFCPNDSCLMFKIIKTSL